MARIKFREWNPTTDTMERVVLINQILAEYEGHRVTVRQVYYRLVSANKIENTDKEYNRVQELITTARYGGLIDWDAIEDRNRAASKPREWKSGQVALDDAKDVFRLDRWEGQHCYVELAVEKAALAGVLGPIAHEYHMSLLPVRGYGSSSVLFEWANRIRFYCQPTTLMPHGRIPVVLYIGDFDPSGEDMVRDIRERLTEFHCLSNLSVRKLALTMDQIEQYKPPPNPAKKKDSRAKAFIAEHGRMSWEADALPPKDLALITRTAINTYVDKAAMNKVIAREKLIKAKMKLHAETFKEPT